MRRHRRNRIGNAGYQRELALSMINSLGLNQAIRTCLENGWTGTLGFIMKLDETPARR